MVLVECSACTPRNRRRPECVVDRVEMRIGGVGRGIGKEGRESTSDPVQ